LNWKTVNLATDSHFKLLKVKVKINLFTVNVLQNGTFLIAMFRVKCITTNYIKLTNFKHIPVLANKYELFLLIPTAALTSALLIKLRARITSDGIIQGTGLFPWKCIILSNNYTNQF
jgi:hypothetical protein